jgi:hypothetical protein
MALSMATIGSADEELAVGIIDSIPPQERMREDLTVCVFPVSSLAPLFR